MSRRSFYAAALLAILLIAGVASYYASSHPDGLEYVAERTGFLHAAEDSPTADSPLADYGVRGVDDARLSGGLAGLIGCAVVLALMSGLAYALRRRSRPAAEQASDRTDETDGATGGAGPRSAGAARSRDGRA